VLLPNLNVVIPSLYKRGIIITQMISIGKHSCRFAATILKKHRKLARSRVDEASTSVIPPYIIYKSKEIVQQHIFDFFDLPLTHKSPLCIRTSKTRYISILHVSIRYTIRINLTSGLPDLVHSLGRALTSRIGACYLSQDHSSILLN
jgi:hypothetical protein